MLAAVAVYLSLADDLRGRRVVHFVDNMAAMAALTNGYSRVVDAAKIVHAFSSWCAGAQVSVWFEYVRSKANIADLPSRGSFDLLNTMGSVWADWQWPSVGAWDRSAAVWLRAAATAPGQVDEDLLPGRGRKRRRQAGPHG